MRINRIKALALCAALAMAMAWGCTEDKAPAPKDRCDAGTRCGPDQGADLGELDQGRDQGGQDQGQQTLDIPVGCNPLAFEADCLLPYPSDVFLVSDATMPSGKRVALTPRALPTTSSGEVVNFYDLHPADGYSPVMPILAYFPEGVSVEGVVFHTDDLDASRQPTSKTLLIDADAKTLVAHWAEVDRSVEDPTQQAFIVRPASRLKEKTRYIVAFQGLKRPDGSPLQAPRGFRELRDKSPLVQREAALAELAPRYEAEVFGVLQELGIAREGLVLAWDFTTKSDEHAQRNMFKIRQELMARFEQTPPVVALTKTVEAPSAEIALRLEGTIEVPLYMSSDKAGATLLYDEQGLVRAQGVAKVPFTLQVPRQAMPEAQGFSPARIMQYGHGFFGAREEINYSFMRGFSQEKGFITAAVDWWGMSEDDQPPLLVTLVQDINKTFTFTDRVHQGLANQIALSYALKGPIAQLPELQRFGAPLYDASQLYYYGISQGHIFGSTFVPLSPHIDRAVFSVGGVSYSMMMSRSTNFAPFLLALRRSLRTPLALQKFIAMSQHPFDRVDPVMYTEHLLKSSLPGAPEQRHILMQIGLGDAQVNNLTAYLQARASGIPLMTPSPVKVWGLPEVQGPTASALVVASFGIDPLPGLYSQTPSGSNEAHEGVRRVDALKRQIDAFLRPDGAIEHLCDGACDPD